jgi:hypothetical protein
MRCLHPGAVAGSRRAADIVLTGIGICPVDEPIGVIYAYSSVLGGTLTLITVPESTRHDIADWRSS